MVSACIIITEADGEVSFVVIERDINMISQPSAQQIVGLDHVNETTIPQGWHYGFINVFFNIRNVSNR